MKRKIIAVIMSAICLFAFVGCAKTEGGKDTGKTPSSEEEQAKKSKERPHQLKKSK